MEVEAINVLEEAWDETQTGPCLSCLMEDELNDYGLCGPCTPDDPEHRKALLALLKQRRTA